VKRASVRQRRTLQDGHRVINVVCPICDHRHWLPDAVTGRCPRRPGAFTIANPRQPKAAS
jgi:hypothetical protein